MNWTRIFKIFTTVSDLRDFRNYTLNIYVDTAYIDHVYIVNWMFTRNKFIVTFHVGVHANCNESHLSIELRSDRHDIRDVFGNIYLTFCLSHVFMFIVV